MGEMVVDTDLSTHKLERRYLIYDMIAINKVSLVTLHVSKCGSDNEMGLGKTIELLACVFAHKKSNDGNEMMQMIGENTPKIKIVKRERVECVYGAVSESSWYGGLWVQCDVCDAWQHADCVGFLDKGSNSEIENDYESQGDSDSVNGDTRKRNSFDGSEVEFSDEVYICQLCSELIQATTSPVATGATLVICPTPILAQWHAEITRHTRPGSLKVLVYEGVKTTPSSSKSVTKIGELLAADIVLTTYDVLKEDLFHDTDRHEGDRHLMRNVNIRLSIFFQHPFSSRWKILENEVIKPRNRERDTLLKSRNPYYRYDLELFRKERLLSTSAVSKLLKEFIPRLSHASDGLIFQLQ
ncbi:E3 ubiquitin protein ligase SHPRH [Tanacetum coccineum]